VLLIVVAIIYPSAEFAFRDSKDWASWAAGYTGSAAHSSSYASHLVRRRGWYSRAVAITCRVRGPAIAACNITVVSL
jgi:hypothetical protein